MLLDDIRRIMASNLSDGAKVKETQRLLNDPKLEKADVPFFDLTISDDRIHKLKSIVPDNKRITSIEVLSVNRLWKESESDSLITATFVSTNEMILRSTGLGNAPRETFSVFREGAVVDFTIIIGFELRAFRIITDYTTPLLLNGQEITPPVDFKIRIHLEEKTNGNN